MPGALAEPLKSVLDPMEWISEVLFGVIMALTFTCTLGIATADNIQVQTMLIGALGCNLAWGIIDGGVYLLTQVNSRARLALMLRAMREAPDLAALRRIIADALPASVASILPAKQLELMRQRLRQLPEERGRSRLTRHDWIGASVVCILSFLATFPIVIPFIFVGEARTALRISNVVATAMLFFCGYAFGQRSGMRPWATGLSMVAIGGGFVGVAISLGG